MTHKKEFSHVDKAGLPSMVDVGNKKITRRSAWAQCKVWLGDRSVIERLKAQEFPWKQRVLFFRQPSLPGHRP